MAGRCFSHARSRALDLMLLTGGIALLVSPLLSWASAAPPVAERSMTVDQRVASSAMISYPLAPDFHVGASGKSVGSVRWDVYTSAQRGYKLALSSDRSPALQGSGCVMNDIGSSPADWSISAGEWGFGISASGEKALSAYQTGNDVRQWRGLNGKRPVEVARYRSGASESVRTTVWLAAENNSSANCADAKVHLAATAFANL